MLLRWAKNWARIVSIERERERAGNCKRKKKEEKLRREENGTVETTHESERYFKKFLGGSFSKIRRKWARKVRRKSWWLW